MKKQIKKLSLNKNMEVVGEHYDPTMGFLPDSDYGFARLQNSYIWDMNKHGSLNYFTIPDVCSRTFGK